MMRLIDADALLSECKLAQKQASYDRQYANAFYSASGDISTEWWCVEDIIEDAPTIEPERKKGKWVCQADDDIWNCSECDYEIDGTGCIDPLEYLKTYKFCPNCGSYNGGEEE